MLGGDELVAQNRSDSHVGIDAFLSDSLPPDCSVTSDCSDRKHRIALGSARTMSQPTLTVSAAFESPKADGIACP